MMPAFERESFQRLPELVSDLFKGASRHRKIAQTGKAPGGRAKPSVSRLKNVLLTSGRSSRKMARSLLIANRTWCKSSSRSVDRSLIHAMALSISSSTIRLNPALTLSFRQKTSWGAFTGMVSTSLQKEDETFGFREMRSQHCWRRPKDMVVKPSFVRGSFSETILDGYHPSELTRRNRA